MSLLIVAAMLAQSPTADTAGRRVMLTGYDRVRIDGPFEVTIRSGGAPSAQVAGDARAFDRVRLRVDGTTLTIAPVRAAPGQPVDPAPLPAIALDGGRLAALTVRGRARVRVDRMAAPRVDLSLTGDGSVDVAAIDTDDLRATLVGAGRMRIAGRGAHARFAVNGSAGVDAAALVADELVVAATGTGDGRYHARYVADVGASGSGPVTVTGNPQCRTHGNAPIRCGR